MTALNPDLSRGLAAVVQLHRPVEESEPPRTEEMIGHQALWELATAEAAMDELDGGGEPGQPLADRLRTHFGLRGVQS